MTRINIVIAAAFALAVTLPTVSAQAQSPRTFVSAAGSDSNPCSFAAPCRHFQTAVNATSAGGEVDALDPAGYGPITISQAITIEGQGWSYIAPPAGGNGITINAVKGNVSIHGVSLNGVGIAGSTTGIVFNSGGSLTIENSVVRNFTSYGIAAFPTASSELVISNTVVSDVITSGAAAISIQPQGSGITTKAALNHVELDQNYDGITIGSTQTGTINVTIANSLVANNSTDGIDVFLTGATVFVMVRDSTIANNNGGVIAEVSGSTIRLAHSTITANSTGWAALSGGVVESYGDNNIDNNTSGNGAPSSIPTK
jgi:hypothetical protein